MPAFAPISIAMLQQVIRPAISSFRDSLSRKLDRLVGCPIGPDVCSDGEDQVFCPDTPWEFTGDFRTDGLRHLEVEGAELQDKPHIG